MFIDLFLTALSSRDLVGLMFLRQSGSVFLSSGKELIGQETLNPAGCCAV